MMTKEIFSTEAADVLLQLIGRLSLLYQQETLTRSMTEEITLFCMQYWTVYLHTQVWHISPCLSRDTEQERHLQIALESSRFKEKNDAQVSSSGLPRDTGLFTGEESPLEESYSAHWRWREPRHGLRHRYLDGNRLPWEWCPSLSRGHASKTQAESLGKAGESFVKAQKSSHECFFTL